MHTTTPFHVRPIQKAMTPNISILTSSSSPLSQSRTISQKHLSVTQQSTSITTTLHIRQPESQPHHTSMSINAYRLGPSILQLNSDVASAISVLRHATQRPCDRSAPAFTQPSTRVTDERSSIAEGDEKLHFGV
jgi:hypothetical protein